MFNEPSAARPGIQEEGERLPTGPIFGQPGKQHRVSTQHCVRASGDLSYCRALLAERIDQGGIYVPIGWHSQLTK